MLQSILGIILGVLQAIPIFNKWFTKTTEQKIEDKQKELRDEIDEFKKTGRPT